MSIFDEATAAIEKHAAVTKTVDRRASAPQGGYEDDEDYVNLDFDSILAATDKLLAVNRGQISTDERDSQEYKRYYTTPSLLRERVRLDSGGAGNKMMRMASRHKSLKGWGPFALDDQVLGHLISNPLSTPLEEINPMQLVEQARRVTQMGQGGIGSENAISGEMQAVLPSQFGFLSPLEGPESAKIGVDARLAWGARVGSDGRLYQKVRDRRTGKMRWMSPRDLAGTSLGLPK